MQQWKITLAYDGTPYRGWQVQPGLPTVQGLLADALYRTAGERVLPQGSGRTDTGVHALAQVASFTLAAPIPAANLQRALNRCLPPSIRVLSVEPVPPQFHARHSARCKTYEYRIFPLKPATAPNRAADSLPDSLPDSTPAREPDPLHHSSRRQSDEREEIICPPTFAPYVWPCPWPLSLDALNQAARHVLGTHDFTSFAAADPDLAQRTAFNSSQRCAPLIAPVSHFAPSSHSGNVTDSVSGTETPRPHAAKTAVRTITRSEWCVEGGLLIYRVTANGFLHHMVRNLVGTFVQAGAHRIDPDSIPALLAARNRAVAGPTAPATGLFLVSVEYPAAAG